MEELSCSDYIITQVSGSVKRNRTKTFFENSRFCKFCEIELSYIIAANRSGPELRGVKGILARSFVKTKQKKSYRFGDAVTCSVQIF